MAPESCHLCAYLPRSQFGGSHHRQREYQWPVYMGDQRRVMARMVAAADEENETMKKYILFDHDGVLVDTEFWYYKAGERALADIGFTLDKDQYLRDMTQSLGTWSQARAAVIDEQTIS